jgi:colanic acid/amylovoran biosynthesis glycosyltransferase
VIAYLVHRFPVATQTFTYDELMVFERKNLETTVFSFRPGEQLDWPLSSLRVRTLPSAFSAAALGALVWWTTRAPARLLRSLIWALAGPFLVRPSLRERITALLSVPRGALLAREPSIALFHAQFSNETATTALIAAHLSRRPFSFRSHTAPNPQLLVEKLRRAAVVLAISEHDRNELLAVAPGANVVLSPLGIPLPSPVDRGREPGLVVSVGSLIEKKGHHVLIQACARLRAEGLDVRCEIAGAGHLYESLRALAERLGVQDSVRLLGPLSREDVLDRVATASVFALAAVPSRIGVDGVPVALIEAMAVATPPVSTALSGIPELVRDDETGLLVEPGDVTGLVDALRRLLTDERLRARLGESARAHVRSERDAEVCYAAAAELLSGASVC